MNFKCAKCTKEFESKKALAAHQISHKEGKRYKTGREFYSNKMPRQIRNCLYCKSEFEVIENSTKKYCCNSCQQNYSIEESIKSGSYTRPTAFSWFKKNTEYKCKTCGIYEWQNKKLTLQIDHIDGNNKNNLVENLRYLCPNCHTQTDTWGVKNASPDGYARLVESNRKNARNRRS